MADPSAPATKNPFATFAVNPAGVTFESQEEGEEIILLLRMHIVTLIPAILVTILLFFLPVVVIALVNLAKINLTSILAPQQVLLILVFWYLFVFAYAFYRFLFWYFNVYILTNERVIDFDFRGILNKQAAYTKLQQIEDVTPKMIGFFRTFFNFGDVLIQTAGEMPEFEFDRVPRPDAVAERILLEARKEEAEAPGEVS